MRKSDIGPFAIVPDALLRLKASSCAIHVWCVLQRHANSDCECWPSLAQIAKLTGRSKPTVIRAIAELEQLKALVVIRNTNGTEAEGQLGINGYVLLYEPAGAVKNFYHPEGENFDFCDGVFNNVVVNVNRNVNVKNEEEKNMCVSSSSSSSSSCATSSSCSSSSSLGCDRSKIFTTPPLDKRALDELFEEFWEAYPKRQGTNPKALAKSRFLNLCSKGTNPDDLCLAAMNYRTAMEAAKKIGTEYVQQAATFLGPKNQTWMDYLDTEAEETYGE